MLKKVMLISGIVLLSCALLGAVLTPFAVKDTVKLGQELDAQYRVIKEELSVSSEGVQSVHINGRYIEHITVRPSADDNIHLYTNGYRILETSFPYSIEDEGELRIYVSTYHYTNFFTFADREVMLKSIASWANNTSTNSVEIHVPEGVVFDTNVNSWGLAVENGVETINTYVEEVYDEYEPFFDDDYFDDYERSLSAEEILELAGELRELNDDLMARYQMVYEGENQPGEFAYYNGGYEIINEMAEKLAHAYEGDMERYDFEAALREYGYIVSQQNVLVLAREAVQQQYTDGAISKEEFYARDLELDRFEETLEEYLVSDYAHLDDEIRYIENRLNVDVLLNNIVTGVNLRAYSFS